jgi:hypothetical protein
MCAAKYGRRKLYKSPGAQSKEYLRDEMQYAVAKSVSIPTNTTQARVFFEDAVFFEARSAFPRKTRAVRTME